MKKIQPATLGISQNVDAQTQVKIPTIRAVHSIALLNISEI